VEHPKRIGDRSALAVMLALADVGYELYVPFGENTRSDLVLDDGRRLQKVQCKTGRLRNGAVRFKTCSSYAHHRNPRSSTRPYLAEIDAFGVYCRETGGVYLVPIDEVPLRRQAALRVSEPLNNQRSGIRFAAEFLVATIALV
jgi:hypothetical protein